MEMNMQKTNKPIMILREEFTTSLAKLINESGLPLFVIEPILRDILIEVNMGVKRQYEIEKAQYEQSLMNAACVEGEQNDKGKV